MKKLNPIQFILNQNFEDEGELWFEADNRSLRAREDRIPEYDEWASTLINAIRIQDAFPYLLGDWVNIGQSAYGEKYTQAMTLFPGYSPSTFRNYASIMGRVKWEQRNFSPHISFSHHQAVAKFHKKPDLQVEWLERAEQDYLSVQEFKRLINPSEETGGDAFLDRMELTRAGTANLIELAPNPEIRAIVHTASDTLSDAETAYRDYKSEEELEAV